jgi:hypothetical protein
VKAVLQLFSLGCRALYKGRDPAGLFVETENTFRQIMELSGKSPTRNAAFLSLDIPLDHPNLPEVLRIIKEETRRIPIPHHIPYHSADRKRYFSLKVVRQYEEKDLRNLPYVNVRCSRQIAESRDPIQTEDERYLAKANNKLKARWDYGNLGFLQAYAMTTRLKSVLEKQGMQGFRLRPVLFDHPEKAAKELWQPWSDVIMPRCLLPLVDNESEPTLPDALGRR